MNKTIFGLLSGAGWACMEAAAMTAIVRDWIRELFVLGYKFIEGSG